MRKIFLFILVIFSTAYSQENNSSSSLDLFSPTNIKKFADYLFCQKDYLRAVDEYYLFLKNNYNDTVDFKVAIALSQMGKYDQAADMFLRIQNSSKLYSISIQQYLKTIFLKDSIHLYRKVFKDFAMKHDFKNLKESQLLYNFSFLFTNDKLPDKGRFLLPYSGANRDSIAKYFEWKENPPHKNPLTAAFLSAVIPGLGKFYTHEYSDGIFAFLATGILGYLSYTNFSAKHYLRAWLFTGLTAGFYGGNIYGSAASAQLYNAKINFEFTYGLKVFLDNRNYFIPQINFCR